MQSRVSTSLQVYRAHIRRLPDGKLDASGVVSRECYLEWLATKGAVESDAESRKYHRTLTNHLSGIDGRSPFFPEEEAAILVIFRRKQPWPCFPPHLAAVGQRYRARGYHEKKRDREMDGETPTAAAVVVAKKQEPTKTVCACTSAKADDILQYVSSADAAYLKNLGSNIVRNFGSVDFSLTQWKAINQVLRFMILGKTRRCCINVACPMLEAENLCREFDSVDDGRVVMVFDMTASEYTERALAQNMRSIELFGQLIGNPEGRITEGSELLEVVMAVGAAYHTPGKKALLSKQKMHKLDGTDELFDMMYYVSPESYLLVICGTPCSNRARLDNMAVMEELAQDLLTLDNIEMMW